MKQFLPHAVHLDNCDYTYKLNEMAIGEIVEKTAHAYVIKYKFQVAVAHSICHFIYNANQFEN